MPARPLFAALAACVLLYLAPAPALARGLDVQIVQGPETGVEAWLVEDHSVPVVSLSFAFLRAGSAADPPDTSGLAALAAATLDEGAGDLDAAAFQDALAAHAIEMSFAADRDALTGRVRALTEHRDEALRLLTLALTAPRFDPEAVERMRTAAMARVRSDAADPQWRAQRLLNATAFAGHPYAANSGGSLSGLAAITPEDVRAFARGAIARDRLIIGVAGDMTAQDLEQALDAAFGPLPLEADTGTDTDTGTGTGTDTEDAGAYARPPKAELQGAGQVVVHPHDGPQSAIALIAPGLRPTHSKYAVWEVVDHILGGAGFGSRLMGSLREEGGLTYGVYTYPVHLDRSDTLRAVTSVDNTAAGRALELIRAGWESLRTTPPTEEEMAAAKAALVGEAALRLTSTPAIAGYLVELRRQGLPPGHLARRAQALAAVTPKDVQALAERKLDPAQVLTVIVGRPEGLEGLEGLDAPPVVVDTIPGIE
jgi:zinc protease